MPPDYTDQLNRIAAALNRPATPVWLVALISTLFGAVSTVVVQFLLMRSADQYKRHKMRQIIYNDINVLYASVRGVLLWNPKTAPPGELPRAKVKLLREKLHFNGEKYLHDNQDVYIQLDEHQAIDGIYGVFHRVNQCDEQDYEQLAHVALAIVWEYAKTRQLRERYIKKYFHSTIREDISNGQLTLESYAMTVAGRGEDSSSNEFSFGPVKK